MKVIAYSLADDKNSENQIFCVHWLLIIEMWAISSFDINNQLSASNSLKFLIVNLIYSSTFITLWGVCLEEVLFSTFCAYFC